MSRALVAVLVFLGIAVVLGLPASPASAHERREVGRYVLVVGWNVEPTFANAANALFLKVEDAETEQGVAGLDETLQAEIIVGGGAQKKDLPLEAHAEEPGVYLSPVIPTAAGDYTFRIFGTIDGQAVDESFSSGPETFESVEDAAELQFPDTPPSNAAIQRSLDDLSAQVADLDSGSSDTALILAIIGIAAGAVGIGAGAFALARRSG